jgi:hypothetical protein
MTNSKPFDIILDAYIYECTALYGVVQSLFNYPDIGEDEDLHGKLYASAFTFLCQDYLKTLIDFYIHDDFDAFVGDMNFKLNKKELHRLKEISTTIEFKPEDFSELVWALIKDYQLKIAKDIHMVFPSEKLKLRLFASIFKINDGDATLELTEDTLEFMKTTFNRV